MDVIDRAKKEKALSDALWATWMEWSDVPKSRDLTKKSLSPILQSNAVPHIANQWNEGYSRLAEQLKAKENRKASAAILMLFLDDWTKSLQTRWDARVRKYESAPAEEQTPWEYVRGEGVNVQQVEPEPTPRKKPSFDLSIDPPKGYMWVEMPTLYDPRDPRRVLGAKPLVLPSDADRESVGLITDSNTRSEMTAAKDYFRQGGNRLEAIWRVGANPCERCLKLNGMPMKVWIRTAPFGPKLHINCNCFLEWLHVLASTSRLVRI